MNELLLHHCCGPCSPAVVDHLRASFSLRGFWFNPNIHPEDEYRLRFDSFRRFAASRGIAWEEGEEFSPERWLAEAPAVTPDRCRYCYAVRLRETARTARLRGIGYFSTTLLVSPYQRHEAIREIAEAAAREEGIEFVYHDLRASFYRGKDAARALGLYLQKYCGCRYSMEEREAQRREKESRKAPRAPGDGKGGR